MNYTLNFTNWTKPEPQCMHLGKIDTDCLYRMVCKDTNARFESGAYWLIGAFFLADFLLPIILERGNFDTAKLKAKYPLLLARLPDLQTQAGQAQAIAWVKARVLWGCVLWITYNVLI